MQSQRKFEGPTPNRTVKERKRRQIVAQEKAQADFRKQGSRSLRPKRGENQEDMDIAGIEEIGKFWKGIWEERGQYDLGHPALEHWKAKVNGMGDRTETPQVSRDSRWKAAVKGMACWKALGLDKIHGFWHKAFPQTNSLLKNCIWEIIDGSGEMPDWVVRGRTVMIPKDGFSGRAEQYRPITCLNTLYKLMTATMAGIILEYATKCEALPKQKALCKGTRGCLDDLIIDQAVTDEAKKRTRGTYQWRGWITVRLMTSSPTDGLTKSLGQWRLQNPSGG